MVFEKTETGMKKGKVIVTISGTTGSGKSLIAEAIERTLKGYNVEFSYDDAEHPYLKEERENTATRLNFDEVIKEMNDRVEVVIQERQLARKSGY